MGRRAWGWLAVVGLCASACSVRGVNGEASDDRAASRLRASAGATLGRSFRFAATGSKGGAAVPGATGTFSPPDRIVLDAPAPDDPPAVANPWLLLSDLRSTRYATRAGGAVRFNLAPSDLDALVGGTSAVDDDFAGEAFVSGGRVVRVRFQATRAGVHYLGDVRITGA